MTKTLGSALKRAEDRPSGFDYLRLSLAVSIVAWHTIAVCYGPQAEAPLWTQWFRPLPFFIIPAFFALSGFLVAGSLNAIPSAHLSSYVSSGSRQRSLSRCWFQR